jgi:hypothetical protein
MSASRQRSGGVVRVEARLLKIDQKGGRGRGTPVSRVPFWETELTEADILQGSVERGALALPAVAGLSLALALVLGPRGPLVALAINVFVMFEVAGFSDALRLTLPAACFRATRRRAAR